MYTHTRTQNTSSHSQKPRCLSSRITHALLLHVCVCMCVRTARARVCVCVCVCVCMGITHVKNDAAEKASSFCTTACCTM